MKTGYGDLTEPATDAEKRQSYVTNLFDNLAPTYDRFNRLVSFSRDEAWRNKTIELLDEQGRGKVLDLAAGTGDLALCAARRGAQQVHILDISFKMLMQAKPKLLGNNGVSAHFAFEQGSADRLPFREQSLNGIVSGFAMRNVFHFLDDVLREMHRVLKPGGRFAILEMSRPENPLLRFGFRLHLRTIMPLVGRLVSGETAAFRYLRQTTMTFLAPEEFGQRLQAAGFDQVAWRSHLLGGIAIHHGRKPQN